MFFVKFIRYSPAADNVETEFPVFCLFRVIPNFTVLYYLIEYSFKSPGIRELIVILCEE